MAIVKPCFHLKKSVIHILHQGVTSFVHLKTEYFAEDGIYLFI